MLLALWLRGEALVLIGLDYWQVVSHYPWYFTRLAGLHMVAGDEVHIISAIGPKRQGTIEAEVRELGIPFTAVHEVVFSSLREPRGPLKLAKCLELGIEVFYDDREEVCQALTAAGILAFRVPRLDRRLRDAEAERRMAT